MTTSGKRFHELDALRAVAMSLGVLLHSILFFVPYRPQGDDADEAMGVLVDWVHGFRMPVFFLLSGYFTALLIARRGLVRTLVQRALRIGVPFFIGVFTLIPLIEWVATETYDWIIREGRYRPLVGGPPTNDGLAHLWFLWFLVIFVALTAVVVVAARLVRRAAPKLAVPAWVRFATIGALACVPLVAEATTSSSDFGPPTDNSWSPDLAILAYHLAFFAVGALLYGRTSADGGPAIYRVGRWWVPLLIGGPVVIYPLALLAEPLPIVSAIAQVAYAWAMTFGLIGLFRRAFSRERFWVRFASDSAYWLYLIHLPVVIFLQGVFTFTDWPGALEALLVAVLATLFGLLTYATVVRYTPLGWLLNGRRSLRADLRAIRRTGASTPRRSVAA